MLTDCCFIGIEVEGPDRHSKTLFIADKEANPVSIAEFLCKNKDFSHVYFGAGRNYGVSDFHIPLIKTLIQIGKKVIVETDDLSKLSNIVGVGGITIVLAIKQNNVGWSLMEDTRIKIEDEHNAVVFSGAQKSLTSLTDPLYKHDLMVNL